MKTSRMLLTTLALSLVGGGAAAADQATAKINRSNLLVDRGCTTVVEAHMGYNDRSPVERLALNRQPENSRKIQECVERYRVAAAAASR
ncbi:hypothetical protein [Paludibacterium purpuratum]|uniref:Secreted protein n=1 Tax=Paludibacterium purpuratum TaxID=1144873 RepID=A0A4R7BCI1_9NEIS|nr:hypothetical protein [Paludibacterium purpuratum]TDR82744.1 hypothetical protein DFP86_101133 [Paludibacterium purpuratum]